LVIAAKGAPEAIADLCHFTEARKKELARDIDLLMDLVKVVSAHRRTRSVA
jgi:hypothetical protein